MDKLMIYLRTLLRVIIAKWNTRHTDWANGNLHFIPLYPDGNALRANEKPLPYYNRPTLCDIYVESAFDHTPHPNLVDCFSCAKKIEQDRERWLA